MGRATEAQPSRCPALPSVDRETRQLDSLATECPYKWPSAATLL